MAESKAHEILVGLIIAYVKANHRLLDDSLFTIDDGECNHLPPQMGDGYRPDFMYQWGGVLIIGEAKTPLDLDNRHSISQYRSYIRRCEQFEGESHLILSTTLDCEAAAKNLLNRLKKELNASKTRTAVITRFTFVRARNAAD